MRVLHFFKTYLPDSFGGIERVIWEIAEGTGRHGVETDVLSLSCDPKAASIRVGNHFAHKARLDLYVASTGFSLSAFRIFADLASKADILHYHFPYPFADLVHFATGMKKPVLVTYHSDIVSQKGLLRIYRPLMHAFLARADAIVATSPNYLASSEVLQRYADKTSVIPIALDAGKAAKPDEGLVAAWQKRVGTGFFLFVGTLRRYKGLPFLLQAAKDSGLPVIIAGSGPDEPALRTLAIGLANVTVLGEVADDAKAALLSLCRAFVLPSHLRTEAFGIALLEAAMAGRPLISCELGTGTSYINATGETGLVVAPADGKALAEAMLTLNRDEAMAERMGRAARTRATALFSAERMASSYVALYERLASHAGRRQFR